VEAVTADVNRFDPGRRFDRVLSIEMLEHTRNWEALLGRVAAWLRPDGRAFVHVFSHRRFAYPYRTGWLARNFFTAGLMPSHELLAHFQRDLRVVDRWAIPGTHYERTARAWLERLDAAPERARAALAQRFGERAAGRLLARWRLFFIACAGTWGYRGGREWMVSHYLFAPRVGRGV
jgi:cyclopropane-fatty-acyl-phospholipid synthase